MQSGADSDRDLLRAAQGGHAASFGALFDRYRDRVFGHALRLTESRADAEDATAIVFLEAWRKQDRIRDVDGSVLPWLLATTTNVTRNLNRASRRYRNALLALPRDNERAAEPTFADPEMRRVLAMLNETDRVLLALTALEGFSTAEAAVVVGVTPGAARTRLTRARQRLRAHFEASPSQLQPRDQT